MLINFDVASKVDKNMEEVVVKLRYTDNRRVCESASFSAVLMYWVFGVAMSGKTRLL